AAPPRPDHRDQPGRPHQQTTNPIQLPLTTDKPPPKRGQTSRILPRPRRLQGNNFPLGIPGHERASPTLFERAAASPRGTAERPTSKPVAAHQKRRENNARDKIGLRQNSGHPISCSLEPDGNRIPDT